MANEENKIVDTQVVTTFLDTAGGVPQGEPHKKKIHKKIKRPKKRIPTLPLEQEKPSHSFISAAANLVLLIAIFTIVFAAHRAIQTSRQASTPVPKDLEITNQQTTDTGEKVIGVQTEDKTAEEPKVVEQEKPVVKRVKHKRFADPYTSGGPLDLDRTTDLRNPWNAGGVADLDSEPIRQKYKKNYLSSNDSDK